MNLITQEDFEEIRQMRKEFTNCYEPLVLGSPHTKWSKEIVAPDYKEMFILDYYRGKIEIKYTYNKRYRKSTVILRFDSFGRHTNPGPNFEKFDGPHVHIFKEGYDDKFAYPIEVLNITPTENDQEVLEKICTYFNITARPSIQLSML